MQHPRRTCPKALGMTGLSWGLGQADCNCTQAGLQYQLCLSQDTRFTTLGRRCIRSCICARVRLQMQHPCHSCPKALGMTGLSWGLGQANCNCTQAGLQCQVCLSQDTRFTTLGRQAVRSCFCHWAYSKSNCFAVTRMHVGTTQSEMLHLYSRELANATFKTSRVLSTPEKNISTALFNVIYSTRHLRSQHYLHYLHCHCKRAVVTAFVDLRHPLACIRRPRAQSRQRQRDVKNAF